MEQATVFWPVVAHVILVFIVYIELGLQRFRAAKAGEITYGDFKVVRTDSDTPQSAKSARNIINNFELPVFFHSASIILFVLNAVSSTALFLAWGFVVARYAHSFIHLTGNNVMHRAILFFISVGFVAALWTLVVGGLLAGS